MKKVNRILLIDDDEPTNFIHKMVIDEAACCDDLVIVESGLEALELVQNPSHPNPDIIFLDINMPKMNGWEFLEAYKGIDQNQKAKIIVMLTTSLNPDDQKKADNINEITGFRNKPITTDMLEEIIENYFPEMVSGEL